MMIRTMKVLLVNPAFRYILEFRHALPFEGKRSVFPPLGLLTVSGLLPRSCERRLVDLEIEPLKTSQIEWADMVFITGMLAQKKSLHETVERCRKLGKLIVLGGPYVTSTIEELPYADHIFQVKRKRRCRSFSKTSHGAPQTDLKRLSGRRCRSRPSRISDSLT